MQGSLHPYIVTECFIWKAYFIARFNESIANCTFPMSFASVHSLKVTVLPLAVTNESSLNARSPATTANR